MAPTGIAAIKARGQTIHSFFKFPPRVIQDSDVKILRDQKLIKNLDTILKLLFFKKPVFLIFFII